jgi:hypothetical protein
LEIKTIASSSQKGKKKIVSRESGDVIGEFGDIIDKLGDVIDKSALKILKN